MAHCPHVSAVAAPEVRRAPGAERQVDVVRVARRAMSLGASHVWCSAKRGPRIGGRKFAGLRRFIAADWMRCPPREPRYGGPATTSSEHAKVPRAWCCGMPPSDLVNRLFRAR